MLGDDFAELCFVHPWPCADFVEFFVLKRVNNEETKCHNEVRWQTKTFRNSPFSAFELAKSRNLLRVRQCRSHRSRSRLALGFFAVLNGRSESLICGSRR